MIKRTGILLVITLFISGCGLTVNQRDAATRFATASSGFGDFTATEFSSLREATIQMNTKDIAIGGTAKLANLDGAFAVKDITARITAATALSSYGSLLMALVGDTEETDLRNASDQFVASVKNVPGQKLSDQQLDALGTVVYDIGGFYIEYQKAKAVRKIVKDAKDDIDHICDLLIQDFNPGGLNLAQGVNSTIKRLKADADIALATSGNNVQNRVIAIEAYKFADDQSERAKVIDSQATSILNALKPANTELVKAIDDDHQSSTDIKSLALQLKNLGTALKVFSGH